MAVAMDRAAGNHQENKAISMQAATKTTKNAVMEDTFGQTAASMKDVSKTILSTFLIKHRNGKGKLIYQDGR